MCENKAQEKKKKAKLCSLCEVGKQEKKKCVYENNSIQMQAQCCKNAVHVSKKKNMEDVLSQKKKRKLRLSVINRSNYAYPQERVCVLRLGRASSSNVPFTIKKTRWCVQYV